jgi:hypothetical protein
MNEKNASKSNDASKVSSPSSQQTDKAPSNEHGKGKVAISREGGRVTVYTGNATPLPANADKSKYFGESVISIPEFDMHRNK